MTDDPPDTASTQDATPSASVVLDGVKAAPGIAIGSVHRYHPTTPDVGQATIEPDEVDAEIALLDQAIDQAKDELNKVRSLAQDQLDPDGEAIFEAQAMMLRDEEMKTAIHQRIRQEHESAPSALRSVLRAYRKRLKDSDDEYLRRRADDLEGLEDRLLRGLQRGKAASAIEPDSIVVADRLTAADVIRFHQHGMRGFVTVGGGHTSHVSIIARALNVPAVVGVEGALDEVADQDRAILDGEQARLLVQPDDDTLHSYRRRAQHRRAPAEEQLPTDHPIETTDGWRVTLRANVEFGEALETLDRYGAEGIGLMRTEMLVLGGREGALTEDKQFGVYRRAAEETGDHGATIRLLDLGGDKILPFAEPEDNPFLGWRGIRVLLDRPEQLLRPQVRALLRANAHGSIRVMLPMVTQLREVRRVRALVEEEADRLASRGLDHDPDLPIGIMVEVPSVALQAEAFSVLTDFMSVGTNDLTQYVLAVDRGNDRVADRFDALHPAVLGLIQRTVKAGEATDTPVSLCGEIASEACAVPILLGLGVDKLSMRPPSLPAVRKIIAGMAREDAEVLAEEACAASGPDFVRRRAHEWIDEHVEAAGPLDEAGALDETEHPEDE